MPSALDIEQKLLEVLDKEADRLIKRAQGGEPLGEQDSENLSYYLRAATSAAKAEVDRIEKLNPETLNDELIGHVLKLGGATPIKKARRAAG